MSQNSIEFSVVITCYFEEESIVEFYTRLSGALRSTGRVYELIFVNDGSTDGTLEKLKGIYHSDPNVTAIVDLFSNAGQPSARTAGIEVAQGQALVAMDSDLQLDPEELPLLIAEYDKGYDIVSGFRKHRRDSLGRRLPSKLANMIMRKASNRKMKDFGCTFKIFNMKLVRAFQFGPFNPWRTVPVVAKAQRISELPVSHHARKYGKSGWTFSRLFAYNMENFVNLSERPFQITGVVCFLLAVLFVLRIMLAKIVPFSILSDVTNGLILNALFVSALIMIAILSAIGEFAIRNFNKLQKRPCYIVRQIDTKKRKDSLLGDQPR